MNDAEFERELLKSSDDVIRIVQEHTKFWDELVHFIKDDIARTDKQIRWNMWWGHLKHVLPPFWIEEEDVDQLIKLARIKVDCTLSNSSES